MPEQKLRATLSLLQEQLENSDELSAEDAALLEEVSDKIDRLLEQTQETRREELPAIQAQVGGVVEQFELNHPELTKLLGAIANTLSSIGI
jgi:F420-dependent methylenetetrahydromethanopterin dehydrogenase